MQLIAPDGVPIVVEHHSGPDVRGLPIVLLHGLSQQRHYWGPILSRLPGRTVVTVDQRAHGDAAGDEVTSDADFSMDRLANDVVMALDELDIAEAIIVGHSWGASVALHTAAQAPDRVRSAVLLDGGLFGPRHLVSEGRSLEQVRTMLEPPPLGMLAPVLWQAIAEGDLAPYWTPEVQQALDPTFRVDSSGRAFTRIGPQRHMAVLDGLIDYDPEPDVQSVQCPVWVVSCEIRDPSADPASQAWSQARVDRLASLPGQFLVQRWEGAIHDVPLQWPALVAGLLETVAERTEPHRDTEGRGGQ